jgi:hypothetical protein
MSACSKSEMGIIQPRQIQMVRVLELLRVAIRGSKHEHNYLSFM